MRLPLDIPPGLVRPGTLYKAKGRWYESQLVRWAQGVTKPVKGWEEFVSVTGHPQGAHAWTVQTGGASPRLAVGVEDDIYLIGPNSNASIAPMDLASGRRDAGYSAGGFGVGLFGVGPYGVGDTSVVTLLEANSWQLDNYGEDLVAVSLADGRILYYDTSAGGAMAAIANSPANCVGVVVTPEEYIVALGADGDPRKIRWPERDDITAWTITASNDAEDRNLPGTGQIMAGRRGRDITLIWTTTELYLLRYVGGSFIYNVSSVGTNCGPISRRSMVVLGSTAVWMSDGQFHRYNGFTEPLPCPVLDAIFGPDGMNPVQKSKVHAVVDSRNFEITWYYCGPTSADPDRFVTFNYLENHWRLGQLDRAAGVDVGVWPDPILVDNDGQLYRHEVGNNYGSLTPYAITGPIELGNGDRVMTIQELIPDFNTTTGVTVTFLVKFDPNEPEVEYGPYSLSSPIPVRIVGRQFRLRIDQVEPDWRYGVPSVEVEPGSLR